jgi:HK97 family phage major capsid protein
MNMDELKNLLEEQGKAFHEFKVTNDERLAAIEKSGKASPEMEAKVEAVNKDILRLEEEIKALTLKTQRPGIGKDGENLETEHKAAIFGPEGYMRKGENGKDVLEFKTQSLQAGNDPYGGYLLPQATVGAIDRVAQDEVAMYSLATVTPIGGGGWEEPVVTTGMTAGHTGETGTRAQTTPPKLSKIKIEAEESYVMPASYNKIIEDSSIDLESWLVTEAGYSFADLDDADFISGTGTNSARGITAYTWVADASYAWDKVGYIVSGKSSAFADTNPADAFISLETALKSKYLRNATYLMNRTTLAEVRKLKDGFGNYLWQPGLQAGIPNSINGIPYRTSDNMAAIGATSYSIALADFRAAYRIVTRRGMTILRDPYTTKGLTYFYISKRLGGGIKNFEAIKFMRFST